MSATAFERIRAAAPALSVGMATADLSRLGEDLIVTGSAVFDGKDALGNARALQDAMKQATA
jgi:hypothetical protein